MPSVSVLVTNYAHESFLDERLASIAEQNYPVDEVLIVDDCSPDNSWSIIQKWCHGRRGWRCRRNGVSHGTPFLYWDEAISELSGEYLWIAESDDMAHREFLSTMISTLEEQSSAALAFCASRTIDQDGRSRGRAQDGMKIVDSGCYKYSYTRKGVDEIRSSLSRVNVIRNVSSVVFRRRIYNINGGVNKEYALCADWDLWIRMLVNNDVCYVADELNYYRTHADTARNSARRDYLDINEACRIVAGAILMCESPMDVLAYYMRLVARNAMRSTSLVGIRNLVSAGYELMRALYAIGRNRVRQAEM